MDTKAPRFACNPNELELLGSGLKRSGSVDRVQDLGLSCEGHQHGLLAFRGL